MPYGGDPVNSNADALRSLIRDTSTAAPLLTDNEVTWLLSRHANVDFAAAAGADMLAAGWATRVTDKSVGDLRLRLGDASGDVGQQYRTLADSIRANAIRSGIAPAAGGISVQDKIDQRADTDRPTDQAAIGMHDWDGPEQGYSTSQARL